MTQQSIPYSQAINDESCLSIPPVFLVFFKREGVLAPPNICKLRLSLQMPGFFPEYPPDKCTDHRTSDDGDH